MATTDLTFRTLRDANLKRCEESYHPLDDWSLTDWACALTGEVGELCNEIKRLRQLSQIDLTPGLREAEQRINARKAAMELADVVIYADLLAQRLGFDLASVVREKFNATSQKIGSDVRIPNYVD